MSIIKGIEFKDLKNKHLFVFESRKINVKPFRNVKNLKLSFHQHMNLNKLPQLSDEIIAQTHRNHVKYQNSEYEKYYDLFLNSEIRLKDIQYPIDIIKQIKKPHIGSTSLSSRSKKYDQISSKNESTLSNSIIEQKENEKNVKILCKSNFKIGFVVGKGGFGKVWKVHEKKTGKIYAMKQMSKLKIINKQSVNSVMNEKILLEKLSHPFLVNMKASFQDQKNLYLILDYVNGGDLRYHICNKKITQIQTKFFVGCILIALQYLHKNKIIHRDLKPENLVIDNKGYVRLTDLGVSKEFRINNELDTSGTPGYMAPEVICKSNHSFTSDFFALGIIVYQLMFGKRPYLGRNRKQIRQQILAKQVKIQEVPIGWSPESVDFVNKLIQRKPQNRLGHNGISSVKNHPWLKDFDWKALQKKTISPPYIPLTIQQDYVNYQQCISSDTIITESQEDNLLLKLEQAQQMFEGYQTVKVKEIKNNKQILRKSMNFKDLLCIEKGLKKIIATK